MCQTVIKYEAVSRKEVHVRYLHILPVDKGEDWPMAPIGFLATSFDGLRDGSHAKDCAASGPPFAASTWARLLLMSVRPMVPSLFSLHRHPSTQSMLFRSCPKEVAVRWLCCGRGGGELELTVELAVIATKQGDQQQQAPQRRDRSAPLPMAMCSVRVTCWNTRLRTMIARASIGPSR